MSDTRERRKQTYVVDVIFPRSSSHSLHPSFPDCQPSHHTVGSAASLAKRVGSACLAVSAIDFPNRSRFDKKRSRAMDGCTLDVLLGADRLQPDMVCEAAGFSSSMSANDVDLGSDRSCCK